MFKKAKAITNLKIRCISVKGANLGNSCNNEVRIATAPSDSFLAFFLKLK